MKKQDKKVYYLTKNGEKALWDKYYLLTGEYNKTTLAMGGRDNLDSDLKENPDIMELRIKAMYSLPKQKQEIYMKLINCIIIEEMDEYKNFDGETVIIGSTVTLKIDGDIEEYTIVGTEEGDPDNGLLSENAAIVTAIMHHKIGETIMFNDMQIEILNVQKAIF